MNEINKENMNLSIGSRLMVHFRHIKKIFQNEEQETKKLIQINLQELEEWLNEKSKPIMEEVNQHVEEILMRIREEIQRARINVEVLENAKLQNPNIPFRAKQYMEGNRKAYIKAINSFLGHMEINNNDYFYLLDFCKQFDELIIDLNKGTLRSYTILQEFFANETSKIAQNLKNFDTLFIELKSVLNNKNIVNANETREKIQNFRIKNKQKINLDVDFKSAEAVMKLATGEKDSIMIEIMNFNNSEENANFISLNEEKKNKEKAFYESQNQVLQSFTALERPLRKYSHIAFEHEELILDYLKEPIETIANDKELKILEILKNMKKMLVDNKLQIDDKKKEKALEEIKKLNKNFIEHFLKNYFSFKTEMEDIESKIKATGVAERLMNFNKKLEDANMKIEKTNEEYKKLKDDVDKLANSISDLKSEIESDIKSLFNEEIKIVI